MIIRKFQLNVNFLCIPQTDYYAKRYVHRQLISKMYLLCGAGGGGSRTSPTDSLSHKLMLNQRLLQRASQGTFHILPPLTRSLEKLHRIIDQEMYAVGAQKLIMPCLAPKQLWDTAGRWDTLGAELFTVSDRTNSKHCLAPTHEEAITSIVAAHMPLSRKQLPIRLYQIGRKFRDEARPKHGLLRCREFEMKDLYTFDVDAASAEATFDEVCDGYVRIFTRLDLPFVQVAASSGTMGGSRSVEFHLLASAGEDTLHYCSMCRKGVNAELEESKDMPSNCDNKDCPGTYQQRSGIEVAHAFVLGTTYSQAWNVVYTDNEQQKQLVYMDCFGIGTTRLLAAAIEVLSSIDEVRWPRLLAPYQICIIPQKEGYKCDVTLALAESVYDELTAKCCQLRNEIVIDDRLHMSIGQRLNEARAFGFPHVIILGKKALPDNPLFEYISIYEGSQKFLSQSQLLDELSPIETI